jgi:signal transduction histidine kinase
VLRNTIGDTSEALKGVTLEKLRLSHDLRHFILDNNLIHFYMQEKPKGSFEKE